MQKPEYPSTIPDNDKLWYYTYEFPLLVKHGTECLLHKNYSNRMHYHDYYEINLVTGGDGLHYFDSRRFHVRKGDYFVIPTHVKHGYVDLGGLDVIHLLVTQNFIDENCTVFFKNKEYYSLFKFDPLLKMHYSFDMQPNVDGDDFNELVAYCKNIVRRQNAPSEESERIIKLNAMAFLFLMFRCYREFSENIGTDNPYYGAMQSVMRYISDNYSKKIDVTDLAALSGYSRSNFFRVFKKVTAMTPNDFIDFFRINAAREMLARGEKNLTDIAVDCGFYDSSHFIRLFKKYTGSTPKKYGAT